MRRIGSIWLWAPLGGLVLVAAVFGYRAGYRVATLTETDVITTYAAQYMQDRIADGTGDGAAVTDCHAVPATASRTAWLVVRCGPSPFDATRAYSYVISRSGRLLERQGPADWRALAADGA